MSSVFGKLAGVLGFSNEAEELDDEYDYSDDYDYEDDGFDNYQSNTYTPSNGFRQDNITGFDTYRAQESARAPQAFGGSRQQSQPSSYSRAASSQRQNSYRNVSQDQGNKVVNLNANIQMEVIVSSPDSLEAAREIAEHIKSKKPVIINLERVEYKVAQRITDFLCGCCCAMNGNVQRIAEKIFMIAPDNVDFAGDMALQETLNQGDLGFLYGDR